MSVNSTLHRDFVPELEALVKFIERGLNKLRQATTIEDRIIIESYLLDQFNDALNLTYEIEELSKLRHPTRENIGTERRRIMDSFLVNASRLRSVIKMYLEIFNSQQRSLLELIGAIRRTNQKIATLHLWDRSIAKWMIVENF